VEKYCTDGQAAGDGVIYHMRFVW